MMGELIKALYKHYVNQPVRENDLWIVSCNKYKPISFTSTDKDHYYLLNSKWRPNTFTIPFDLFIRDEYEP